MSNNSSTNVFVGVSLKNKILSTEQVNEIIAIARARFRARRILFLVADDLEQINLRVFENGREPTLKKKIEKQASKIVSVIDTAIEQADTERTSITHARWTQILSAFYWRTYVELFSLFADNAEFRAAITAVTRKYAQRRKKSPTESQVNYLATYILAELPTLLDGIKVGTDLYTSMIYPAWGDESIDSLACDLSNGLYGNGDRFSCRCEILKVPL